MTHSEGKSLGAMGKKRLGRTRYPQNGVKGGNMAASELSEEPPLTRLELGQARPQTLSVREPWHQVSKMRRPRLTRLGFWADAPTNRPRGKMLKFFFVSNQLLKANRVQFKTFYLY